MTLLIAALVGSQACAGDVIPERAVVGEGASASIENGVEEAAARFRFPASWIRAVMRIESAGQARAVSAKGAMGLMQIMPRTWSELRAKYDLGADPFAVRDNILAGAAYLRELHDRYGEPGFLAAYNAGSGRYEDYLATGRPLPAETIAYVAVAIRTLSGGAFPGGSIAQPTANGWIVADLFPAAVTVARRLPSGAPTARRESHANTGSDAWETLAPASKGLFVAINPRGFAQ